MTEPKPTKKQKKEIVDPISKLLAFMEYNLPKFFSEFPLNKNNINSIPENILTEALVFFFINKVRREGFSFMQQTTQEGKRTVESVFYD